MHVHVHVHVGYTGRFVVVGRGRWLSSYLRNQPSLETPRCSARPERGGINQTTASSKVDMSHDLLEGRPHGRAPRPRLGGVLSHVKKKKHQTGL